MVRAQYSTKQSRAFCFLGDHQSTATHIFLISEYFDTKDGTINSFLYFFRFFPVSYSDFEMRLCTGSIGGKNSGFLIFAVHFLAILFVPFLALDYYQSFLCRTLPFVSIVKYETWALCMRAHINRMNAIEFVYLFLLVSIAFLALHNIRADQTAYCMQHFHFHFCCCSSNRD